MAELEHLEDNYLAVRRDTDLWQSSQLAADAGVIKLEASIPAKEAKPDIPGGTRSEAELEALGASYSQVLRGTKTVELPEVQAIRQQAKEHAAKLGTGELALEEVGKAGRKLAEAVAPGVEVAGRAMGLDEEGAAALSRGLVEFVAGLPGQDESDLTSGIETALAALPMVGATLKGGKMVGKALGPTIAAEFEKATAILKSERGSVQVGKGEKAKAAGVQTPITWEEAIQIDEHQKEFTGLLKTFNERLSTKRRGVRSDAQVTEDSLSPQALQMEAFLNLRPGTILADSDVVAAKRMFKELAEPVRKLSQWVAANPYDQQAFLELLGQMPKVDKGVTSIAGVYAESGRAQRLLSKDRPTAGAAPLAATKKRIEKLNTARHAGQTRRIARLQAELQGAEEEHAFNLREAIEQQREEMTTKVVPPLDIIEEFMRDAKAELRDISSSIDDAFGRDVDRAISGSSDDEFGAVSVAFPKDTDSHVISQVSGLLDELRTLRIERAIATLSKRDVTHSIERVRISDPYINQWLEFFKQQDELAATGAPALTKEKLVEALSSMKTPEEFVAAAKVLAKPSKWDMFIEYWINGLLSGPATHATNIMSNMATIAWAIPERGLASMYSRSVRPSEPLAMLGGILEAQGDAWRLAWQAFKAEESQLGVGKLEGPARAITADALELTGVPGRAVDFLGSMIRLPGRTLLAADDYFKSIAYRAELRALAKREAFRSVNETGLAGASARSRMRDIEQRILAAPPEAIDDAAKEFASYVTFTRDLGEAGQKVQALASTPVGRIVLPFVRTPTNIFKYAGERTPLAFASQAVREEIAAGGPRRALALAKISLGAMTMSYIGMLAAEGIVTGGGPKDKELRKAMMLTGWQPYSFKIGDTYYSYARIEPLGSLFGLGADSADLLGQLSQNDAEQLGAALVVAISRNVANKTFIKGLAGTLNAVSSQDLNIVKSFMEKELPTILPMSTGMGQVAREVDPVMREVNSILDAFKKRVPGYSDSLPPSRNLWGEPILLGGGLGPDLISPIYTSTMKLDPVAQEIVKLELPVSMPSKQLNGVPLDPFEYDAYVVLQGAKPILGEQTLRERLTGVINSELYKRASGGKDGGKAVLIRQWISSYRDMAAHIMSDAELSQQYLGKSFPDLQDHLAKKRDKDVQKFNAPQLSH